MVPLPRGFFCGRFPGQYLPHYVNGVSGDPFLSPFADPPGKGFSSPLMNVFRALFNLPVGYLLWQTGRTTGKTTGRPVTFAWAFAAMSVMPR